MLAELPQQCLCLQPESMRQFRTHHPRPLDSVVFLSESKKMDTALNSPKIVFDLGLKYLSVASLILPKDGTSVIS